MAGSASSGRQGPMGLVGLVADIGGTNARFAIARGGAGGAVLEHVMALPASAHASVEAAAQAYLRRIGGPRLDGAVAACAGPVVDGAVSFTNLSWATTEAGFGAAIGLDRVHLINDLAAVAWAAPVLTGAAVRAVARAGAGPAPADRDGVGQVRAILNAGTGCNASAYVRTVGGGVVVVGEYGHASLAPADAVEIEIWRWLQAAFGRVSIERVLSGPGLLNLYRALCAIEDVAPECGSPAAVSAAARGGDEMAARAVARFCAMLGSAAGDVALCFGARAGVYLAGGVAGLLLTAGFDDAFRSRFEDKGRFRGYLETVPTSLIIDDHAPLHGAARAMYALLGEGLRP